MYALLEAKGGCIRLNVMQAIQCDYKDACYIYILTYTMILINTPWVVADLESRDEKRVRGSKERGSGMHACMNE